MKIYKTWVGNYSVVPEDSFDSFTWQESIQPPARCLPAGRQAFIALLVKTENTWVVIDFRVGYR